MAAKVLSFSPPVVKPRNETLDDLLCNAVIRMGGGVPKGFFPAIGNGERLALFNSPQTGTTLAMSVNRLSAENVRRHIRESDTQDWGWQRQRHGDACHCESCRVSA